MKIEDSIVVVNEQIADGIWRMEVKSPKIAGCVKGPGQFVNIDVSVSWEFTLRRPMSIAGVENGNLSFIYKIFSEGTKRMSIRNKGDILNMLGPLGNTFQFNKNDNITSILIGGGVGIAPILWLHNLMEEKGIEHSIIIGAVNASGHFMDHKPGMGVHLTTDDGTLGHHGTVMPTLEEIFQKKDSVKIYACGPEPMLKAVQGFSLTKNCSTQLSLESYMACGTGICQGCIVELKNENLKEHSYRERYSLLCCDGPVYFADKVIMD